MSLPTMIRELLKPERYPEHTETVELHQTHISFVLVTDNFVYKIKKPVDFGFLDFRTLENRLFYCKQEVELNRRLAPDVYLDVVPVREMDGYFFLDGEDKIVEYAVKMKRLPEEKMMINMLKTGNIDAPVLSRIAKKLVAFHASAKTDPSITACGSLAVIRRNIEENFRQMEKYLGETINKPPFDSVKNYSETFLTNNKELFLERMNKGRIKDCHGDLHMDHLYIMEDICIIDCIEFNERFRYTDVAADIAFLAMDLDFYGRQDLSDIFVKNYIEESGDEGLRSLIDFYKCYRACVRGKVDSFELDDPGLETEEKEKIRLEATKYFRLAAYYAG